MKIRICSLLIALILLFCLPATLSGCASQPPEVVQIYDIVVDLVERSYAANDLLYGYGLPVIAIGSEWAELNYIYNDSDYADYEYVSEFSSHVSVNAIKETLESVYSDDFLATYYTSLFDGFLVGEEVFRARYYESNEWLYQSVDNEPLVTWQRIYDYSTMRLTKPSRADYVSVIIDTHLEGEDEILPVTISITYEDGAWYLDTPTY
ncbi:MAG: hypothetical protein IJW40_08010 [Clostridia bacterium]|nr:hypothetical protein [Clostridia bacterium]